MGENSKRNRKLNRKKKKSEAWEKLMNSFSDDLWTEILLRLPIKSLLQFKSVSKSWFSIISSHRFAKSHLLTAARDDQVVIVHESGEFDDDKPDGSLLLFHLRSGCIFKNLKFPYSQGEYPSDRTFSTIVGSDCGIVCVSVSLSTWRAAKKKYDIYLWNPATKHSKLLPACTLPDNRWTYGSLGFGFDHIDLDFKVVTVPAHDISAEVYSSNRNGWRTIESKLIDIPHDNMFDVCFHGFLFAIGRNSGMMAFDLNKDLFIWDINLPVSSLYDAQSSIKTRVIDFKDTLAVIISNMYDGKIQLWTLDDVACLCGGGVDASWTKVITADLGGSLNFVGLGGSLNFVGGLFNSVLLLLVDIMGDVFFYDLDKKVTSNVSVPDFLETCEFFKYIKSLYLLEGFKRIKWAASSSSLQDSSDCVVELYE